MLDDRNAGSHTATIGVGDECGRLQQRMPQLNLDLSRLRFDVSLTASFVQSPFIPVITGSYTGLVEAPTPGAFAFESSGFLRVNVTSTGAFTGTLFLAGVPYPFVGEFTGSGQFIGEVRRANNFPLTLNFNIDVAPNGTQQIVGTISSNTFVSSAIAKRAAYGPKAPAPSNIVGRYTVVLPPAFPIADAQRDPRGNGIGLLTITPDGTVSWNGRLADGSGAIQRQALARDNTWPLFLNLYRSKGVMLGNITVDKSQTDSDIDGSVNWFKPVVARDTYFPIGFRILDATFMGSAYTPPAAGTRALTGFAEADDNAILTLQEGSLLGDIVRSTTFSATNDITITNPGNERFVLDLDPLSGVFGGSFVHPVSATRTRIIGVLFQKQSIGVGRFPGLSVPGVNPQTGRVLLESKP